MRTHVLCLSLLLACSSLFLSAVAGEFELERDHPPAAEFRDGRGTCRQYTQHNAHYNHSTIFVMDDLPRDRTYVAMNVTHKRAGAVKLVLRAKREGEDLQQVRLKSFGHGGRGQNFVDTTFSDDAAEHFPIWQEEAPFTGVFEPDVHMSKLAGGASAAKWTLLAINRDGHTPRIDSWTLTFCDNNAGAGDGGLAAAEAEAETTFADIANAQGVAITPPAYSPAPHPAPAYYRGPNLFNKGVRRAFFADAVATVYDVIRNYNEANFYVQQVQTLQKKARGAKAVVQEYFDAKHG